MSTCQHKFSTLKGMKFPRTNFEDQYNLNLHFDFKGYEISKNKF